MKPIRRNLYKIMGLDNLEEKDILKIFNWALILTCLIIVGSTFISGYYAGETIVFPNPLPSNNLIWTIIENTTELTVMPEVTINSTNITVYFPSDMPPQSFTIVFLEEQTNEVIKEVHVGGGGSHTKYKTEYVNRTEYVEVPNYIDKEVEKIIYINDTISLNQSNYSKPYNPNEHYNKRPTYVWIGFILLITGLFIFFLIRRMIRKNKEQLNIYGDAE